MKKDKCVLVTGGAKGIGREIVLLLSSLGYDVVINYLNSSLEAIELRDYCIKNFRTKVVAIRADISKEEDVDHLFSEINKEFAGVDILINNASVDLSNLFKDKKVSDFKKTLDVNLIGAYIVSKKVYPYMKEKKWGRIINIASTNGINTYFPVSLEYDASKAALISLTHNLAIEFSPYVNVNAIAPGFIGTESELSGYDKEMLDIETDKILLKRYGDPKEVAYLVKFLISDEANYINNAVIRIDGGQLNS